MWSKIKDLFISKLFLKHIGLIVLVHLIIIYLVLVYLEVSTKHGEKIEVPKLVGLSVEQAKEKLIASKLGFEIIDSVYCPCLPEGTVVEQLIFPTNDTIDPICKCSNKSSNISESSQRKILPSLVYVKSGRTIPLRLSKKKDFIDAPNLVDKQIQFAEDVIKRRGLSVNIKYKPDIENNGVVLEQNYLNKSLTPGNKIPIGSTITLVVGQNLFGEPISTPNLVGMYRNDAIQILKSLNLNNYIINCLGCNTSLDSISNPITKQVPEFYDGATIFKGTQFTLTIGPVIHEGNEE